MATNYNACISSSSRNKLNRFRYVQPVEEEETKKTSQSKLSSEPLANADQENQDNLDQNVNAESPDPPPEAQPSTQSKESRSTKECPKTPANRIPLADLISNTEDAFRLAPGKDQTPDEYVTWQHAPQSSGPSNASPSARGKKRRREGSSPSGSPRKNKARKAVEPFDMKTIKSLLETPQNDVATELWNSYVGRYKGEDGTVELAPKFVNLSSSPHTPVSDVPSKDSSGLRRARSCTVDWPSTASKRKKAEMYKDGRAARELFTRSKSSVLDSGRSSSKLNSLLERIQGSLVRSKAKAEPPSSPPIGDSAAEPREATAAGNQASPIRKGDDPDAPEDNENALKPAKSPGSSSEFEGDEFDDDLLALVDASETPQARQESPKALPKVPSSSGTDSDPPQSPSPAEQRKSSIPVINNDDDDDEFDDGYDFPEELLAQCDQQQQPARQDSTEAAVGETRRPQREEQTTSGNQDQGAQTSRDAQCAGDVSSDEFEGDDIDIDAIEEAMNLSDAGRQKQVG